MLNSLLVWIVALGSVGLYLSRFFIPEIQRKNDLIWSGVGLFYALILLADGDRIRGGLLLGQMASVALIVWFGWEALQQRRQLSPSQTPLPDSVDGILPFAKTGWGRFMKAINDGTLLEDPTEAGDANNTPSIFAKISALVSGFNSPKTSDVTTETQSTTATASDDEDWPEETPPTSEAHSSDSVAEKSPETAEPATPEESESPAEQPTSDLDDSTTTESVHGDEPMVEASATTQESVEESASAGDPAESTAPENVTVEVDSSVPETTEQNPEHTETASETPTESENPAASAENHTQESQHSPADNGDDWPPQDPVT